MHAVFIPDYCSMFIYFLALSLENLALEKAHETFDILKTTCCVTKIISYLISAPKCT